MAIEERIRAELERIARPPLPDGAFERVNRRRSRLRILRRGQVALLTLLVIAGTGLGMYALSRAFLGRPATRVGGGLGTIDNGLIAFAEVTKRGQGQHLYVVRPDGGGLRQLTFGDVSDDDPDWSSDGLQIAFQRQDQITREIRIGVIDVDTGEVRLLTPGTMSVDRPTWSPDGDRIAFAGFGEGVKSGIYVIDANGSHLRLLTGDSFFAPAMPVWSPNGSMIAFTANSPDTKFSWDVYLVNADGSGLRDVTRTPDGGESESPIGWLPNGNLLIQRGPGEIASGPGFPIQTGQWLEMTPEGDVVRVVREAPVNTPDHFQSPSISPDGRFVIFDSGRDGQQNVWYMELASGELTRVTTTGGLAPDWQPVLAGSPVHYVDGARPSPGAQNSGDLEGCVPWSKDRLDVLICAPVPEGWEPPPPPGDYTDYPAVCDAAARIFDERAEELVRNYDLSVLPSIDVESCGAAGRGSEQEGRWTAKFGLANPEDVPPYRSAQILDFTLDGSSEQPVAVLWKEPWPAK